MKLGTKCIQTGWQPKNSDPRVLPIYQSTTFKFDTVEYVGELFDLKHSDHFYTRLSNPTLECVENKISALEGGVGALLTSSGMSASYIAVMNILQAGDHMISTSCIYGGTYNLFSVTLPKMGVEVTFIDQDASDEEISAAFRPNTKLVFGETIANPALAVLDIERLAGIAHAHNCPLIVDNTFPTPILCRPFEWGADIVVHATTKYMDGHAVAIGGVVVDSGNFDWGCDKKFANITDKDPSYHGLSYTEAFGKAAYIVKSRAQLMRDLGMQAAPMNAFLLNLGLETLHLRMRQHSANALAAAEFFASHPGVEWVNYPGLTTDKYYPLAQKYLPDGQAGVISIGIKGGREGAVRFMEKVKMAALVVHVADARTSVLHPASETHRQLTDQQLIDCGISPEMVRVSVGIEDIEDIIADFSQALE